MLDIALLTANASQLKYILQVGEKHQFYTLMLTLIIVSIVLQVNIIRIIFNYCVIRSFAPPLFCLRNPTHFRKNRKRPDHIIIGIPQLTTTYLLRARITPLDRCAGCAVPTNLKLVIENVSIESMHI